MDPHDGYLQIASARGTTGSPGRKPSSHYFTIYRAEDIIPVRHASIELAASVGCSRFEQVSLAVIVSSLARSVMNSVSPGEVALRELHGPQVRCVSVEAKLFGRDLSAFRLVLLHVQAELEDLCIEEVASQSVVRFTFHPRPATPYRRSLRSTRL